MALKARFGVPQQTIVDFSRIRPLIESFLRKATAVGAAAIFSLALQPAFAQHGGGGGHAGGGGGHVGGSGGHASSAGGGSHASGGGSARTSAPHVTATASVQSRVDGNSNSAPAARISIGSAGNRAGLLAFDSNSAGAIPASRRVIPYHVTIGFPPQSWDGSAATASAPAATGAAGGVADALAVTRADSLSAARARSISFFGVGNEFWSEPAHTSTSPSSALAFAATPQHATARASAAAPVSRPAAPVSVPRVSAPVRAPQGASTAPRSTALRPPPRYFAGSATHREAFPRNPRARPRGPVVVGSPICPFGLWCGGYGYGGFGYGGYGFGAFGLGGFWLPDYAFDAGAEFGDPCAPMWFEGCDAYYSGNGMGADSAEAPPDDSDSISAQQMEDNEHNVWLPPDTPEREQNAIAAEKSLTVLYLKDGSVYAVTDFWVADGKLTYETSYGAENSIGLDKLDLERTVNANAARGVPFTMKPKPSAQPAPAVQSPTPPPNAAQPQ